MPYLPRPGAHLFYDISGDGETTILTTHGLTHCGAYWSRTGVSATLADAGFRVVDMDLRGHGRSVPVEGQDPGYTVEHVAADIGALASHLGVERFHLLTHATGGMAAKPAVTAAGWVGYTHSAQSVRYVERGVGEGRSSTMC